MGTQTEWRADFVDADPNPKFPLDRQHWPPFPEGRDLVVTFRASRSWTTANDRAFRLARQSGLVRPFLGELVELTPPAGSAASFKWPPWTQPAPGEYLCAGTTSRGTPCKNVATVRVELGGEADQSKFGSHCDEFCRTHGRKAILDRGPEEARYREWRRNA